MVITGNKPCKKPDYLVVNVNNIFTVARKHLGEHCFLYAILLKRLLYRDIIKKTAIFQKQFSQQPLNHLAKFKPISQVCDCGEKKHSNHNLKKCTRTHHLTIPFRIKHTIGDNSFNKIIKDKVIYDDFKSSCKTLITDLRNHHNSRHSLWAFF